MGLSESNRIQEIQARCDKATPPPWGEKCGVLKHYVFSLDDGEDLGFSLQELHFKDGHEVPAHENGDFIAHAREDIPYLLAQLAQARTEAKRQQYINDGITRRLLGFGIDPDNMERDLQQLAQSREREAEAQKLIEELLLRQKEHCYDDLETELWLVGWFDRARAALVPELPNE